MQYYVINYTTNLSKSEPEFPYKSTITENPITDSQTKKTNKKNTDTLSLEFTKRNTTNKANTSKKIKALKNRLMKKNTKIIKILNIPTKRSSWMIP